MWNWIQKVGGNLQNLYVGIGQKVVGVRETADATQITPQIWAGGAIVSDSDVRQLAEWGITADVDCRLEFDDKSLIDGYNDLPPTPQSIKNHPQIAYLYNGVADDGQPKPVAWFKKTWVFAGPILANGGVVLSHCAAGVNRGPSMAYFLLRAHGKMSGAAAMALLQEKRPIVEVAYRKDADAAIVALKLGR